MNGDGRLKKINISLRAFVTLMIMLLCGMMLVLYALVSNRVYYEKYKKDVVNNIKEQCTSLSDELQNNRFEFDHSMAIAGEISSAAGLLNARIMVVNRDYRIVCDSREESDLSFIINPDVISVMTGEKKEILSDEDAFVHYIVPVIYEDDVRGIIIVNASLKGLKENSSMRISGNITLGGIIMLFCTLGAFLIGYASVRGIKQINRQIENAGVGHLDEQIPLEGFKEFRTLTNSYNNTINKLMVIDSTRQEFVSNVSHELKTPITSMKVLADSLVQNEEADLSMYKEFMNDIIEEIDRESKIITDLLTLVKTDRKDSEMNIEEVSINNLIEVILKRVSPIAQSRGIEITYESYRTVSAEVDEVKLSLAISNIIENAVKYNVDNGWVRVTLNADHKFFHIKVADSGVGIPDDCKEHVFDRFYRVDKARSRDTGGTGLGLSITRNVIRMHKGNIKLYSESGEGTTFTIKIPIKYVEN